MISQLRAEAASWPLISKRAFTNRVVALARRDVATLDPTSQALADELEARLQSKAGGLSLEVLRALRDEAWFDSPLQSHVTLAAHFIRLAESFLERRGNSVALRENIGRARDGGAEMSMHWRWLTLRVPPDLLVAALYANVDASPVCDRVELLSPRLKEVLGRRVAETHLHAKAGMSFAVLWTSWMSWLPNLNGSILIPDPEVPFGGSAAFLSVLLSAAFVRAFLARYLFGRKVGDQRSLSDFCSDELSAVQSQRRTADWDSRCIKLFSCAFRVVRQGASNSSGEFVDCRDAYRLWLKRGGQAVPETLETLVASDPINEVTAERADAVLPETAFAARAISYIASHPDDLAFSELFWQYQRVRCRSYVFLSHEAGTGGLDWFERHYRRLSPLRGGLNGLLLESAYANAGDGIRLASLELRYEPEEEPGDIVKLVRGVARAALRLPRASHRPPEIGLVFHFLKSRTGNGIVHADPRQNGTLQRYGDWFEAQRRRASAIQRVLEQMPSALILIRGVDVASAELSMPSWVTLPLLAQVRSASNSAAHELRSRGVSEVTPVRCTYHAGEDFRRPLEGLRRIHELVEFGCIRTGDRIGHGLALGGDAGAETLRLREVGQPSEERLDDLLWEMDRYGRGDLQPPPGRVERIRHQLRELLLAIYGDGGETCEAYIVSRRERHGPDLLERVGYPRQDSGSAGSSEYRLLRRYLRDEGVYVRGQRIEVAPVDDAEVAAIRALQRWLRVELGRLEVTIESNPSSNLLVSNSRDLTQHPAIRLSKGTGKGVERQPPLHVSINSDDPLTFATCLPDEYSRLYAEQVRLGGSTEKALAWVDKIRRAGWASRFTVQYSARAEWLEELAREPSELMFRKFVR